MKHSLRRTAFFLAMTTILSLGLTACGDTTEEEPPFVAIVTTPQSPEGASYAAAMEESVQVWCRENGCEYRVYTPSGGSTKAVVSCMEEAYEAGAKVIIAAGSGAEVAVYQQQTEHKRQPYLLLDGEPHDADYNYETRTNTHCVLFREEQAGFLAGYAAVMEGYRKLGMIGGVPLTGVLQYQYGFLQGADYAASALRLEEGTVTCHYAYTDSFDAGDAVTDVAQRWFSGGTQLIFSVCGDGQENVLTAAESAGKKLVCSDFAAESESVFTTAEKRIDVAINTCLAALEKNDWSWNSSYGGNTSELGLAEGAVGIPGSQENWPYTGFTWEDYAQLTLDIQEGYVSVSDSIRSVPGTKIVAVTSE